jgi:hypothetical protein
MRFIVDVCPRRPVWRAVPPALWFQRDMTERRPADRVTEALVQGKQAFCFGSAHHDKAQNVQFRL